MLGPPFLRFKYKNIRLFWIRKNVKSMSFRPLASSPSAKQRLAKRFAMSKQAQGVQVGEARGPAGLASFRDVKGKLVTCTPRLFSDRRNPWRHLLTFWLHTDGVMAKGSMVALGAVEDGAEERAERLTSPHRGEALSLIVYRIPIKSIESGQSAGKFTTNCYVTPQRLHAWFLNLIRK